MRIFQAITGTGGKILGSFEAGNIFDLSKPIDISLFTDDLSNKELKPCMSLSEFARIIKAQGYTDQKYAIEIKNFRREELTLDNFISVKQGWISRLPQSFQYVHRYYINASPYDKPCAKLSDLKIDDVSILLPIHQKWFDMIASGEKKYEFRNILPKALRQGA